MLVRHGTGTNGKYDVAPENPNDHRSKLIIWIWTLKRGKINLYHWTLSMEMYCIVLHMVYRHRSSSCAQCEKKIYKMMHCKISFYGRFFCSRHLFTILRCVGIFYYWISAIFDHIETLICEPVHIKLYVPLYVNNGKQS